MRKAEELTNRKMLSLEVVIGYMASITFLVMIFVASFVEMPAWVRIVMIAVGASAFAVGMTNCLKIEHDVGYYECPECGETYIPSMKAVVFAPHIGRSRKMTCPHCGHRAYWPMKKGSLGLPCLIPQELWLRKKLMIFLL